MPKPYRDWVFVKWFKTKDDALEYSRVTGKTFIYIADSGTIVDGK